MDVDSRPAGDALGVDRILAFSDGVFAIAITLLVLDLRPPELHGEGLWSALWLQEWTHYVSYALSFIVIGIVWAQHHHLFTMIRRADHIFLLINIFFLMWLVFVPFPTAVLSEYLNNS